MRRIFLILALLSMLLGCTGNDWIKNQNRGLALGTTYSVIYLADSKLNYQREIDSVFAVINTSLSTYLPDSDISKVNSGDSLLAVDHMFREVMNLSKEVYGASKGAFDPTVGVLVNAWGFGPGEEMKMDSTRVDSLLQYVGFDKVRLNADHTISKAHPNVFFDFNAIAKGYAIDRLGTMLEQKGITDYLVEVGGEVLTKGRNQAAEKKWTVGIDDPQVAFGRQLKKIVTMDNGALASSGNYRKFRIDPVTGEKYVHTIDPKTGYTKNAKVLAASVLAKSCAMADAYATAFMAMPLEDSKGLLQSIAELDAYIIYINDAGKTEEFMTPGFAARVQR